MRDEPGCLAPVGSIRSSSRHRPPIRAAAAALLALAVVAGVRPLLANEAAAGIPKWLGGEVEELGPRSTHVPSDEVMLRNGAVIGDVYVESGNVFNPENPEQDRFLFRLANRLHVPTRQTVIERKLLFREGDPYDPRVLQETARYLRSLDYLYDATVEPIRYHNNRVDVLVSTRDVWTLGVGAGVERAGGENSTQIHLEEANLLGTGRFLDLKYSTDPDRSSQRLRFVDTSVLGSRAELRLWYAHNSDGFRRIFDLAHPFYSLDTRWAASVKVISDKRIEKMYDRGVVARHLYHESTFGEVFGGLSAGFEDGKARRWLAGYTYDHDRLWKVSKSVLLPDLEGLKLASVKPSAERKLSYVWLGFEQLEDGYVEARNMDQIHRTEDFNLGLEVSGRLGWSLPALGAAKSQAIFAGDVRSGWASADRGETLLVSGHAEGRYGSDGYENVLVGGELRFYLRNLKRHRLHVTLQADAAWSLDLENELLLGGDSGLRGYPQRYQDGDRRWLVSLEQRFYTDWELFSLVRVGAAVFADVGRAWHDEGPEAGQDLGVLSDVGFGLRLSSSRSSRGQMVHLDVAFPLNGDVDEVQWLVTSRQSF